MLQRLLQVDSVAAVCCLIGLDLIGTVVKASSDRRLTPLLITFGEWLHSHCTTFLKGSEILCVLIKVFLLLLLVQLQFLSPVLDSSSGAFRW